ncbi:MAG: lipid-A-disaccharide synthase [Alphaproteobacteria bacterium]
MPNTRKQKSIFIIAGEVSGDVLGAEIMSQMPDVCFVGVGGENMTKQGLKSIFPMYDLSVMGIIEVLAHAKTLTKRINQTVNEIIKQRPDVVLTIDSPGFAKSVVNKLKKTDSGKLLIKNGLKFQHVVAPQVWAWRPKRAKKYSKIFDRLYAFFDFELPYFTKYGLDVVAVGHPVSDKIMGKYKNKIDNSEKKLITLIPGSRMNEIKKIMPLYCDFLSEIIKNENVADYKFAVPVLENTREYIENFVKQYFPVDVELIDSINRYDLYEKTYIAIAASGTVSAELAMMHVPAIIVYKMNFITTIIARLLINVKWVSLVNILLNQMIYPELLGNNVSGVKIYDEFIKLKDNKIRDLMIKNLRSADKLWRPDNKSVAKRIANKIFL